MDLTASGDLAPSLWGELSEGWDTYPSVWTAPSLPPGSSSPPLMTRWTWLFHTEADRASLEGCMAVTEPLREDVIAVSPE